MPALIEGVDFYFEGGFMVFTEKFLRDRGYCCESGCRHCPYGFRSISASPRETDLTRSRGGAEQPDPDPPPPAPASRRR